MNTISRVPPVAYFSMEIHLDDRIPTYSGGLGVLAGDTLRAAADLGVPMVAVTLIDRKGYFHQRLDEWGVSGGYPDGLYHPEIICTRDQMAAYVVRAFALSM